MTAAVLLAYEPNDVRPGWIALGLVVALSVATYLLWRSMNTQLGNIQMPPSKTAPPDSVSPDPDIDGAVDSTSGGATPDHADDDQDGATPSV
ncbi:MAG: hypothetical protein ACR2LE_07295 [Nocardioidaceae bacterium]